MSTSTHTNAMLRVTPFVGALLASACSLSKGKLEPVILTPNEVETLNLGSIRPIKGDRKGVGTAFAEDEAKQIFQTLCRSGKPAKKVAHEITFVLPRSENGKSLDGATKASEDHQVFMQVFVANFYAMLAFNDNALDRLAGFDWRSGDRKRPAKGFPLFLVADQDSSAVAESLRSHHTKTLTQYSKPSDVKMFSSSISPVLIRVPGGRPEWLMSVITPGSFFKKETNANGRSTGVLLPPSGTVERVPMELLALTEHYTLIAPSAEADGWKEIAEQRNNGGIVANPEAFLSKDRSGVLPQSVLLKDRQKIWRNYFISNTSIRQSVNRDGDVAFSLALNTESLCSLGRPTSDLRSN